MFRSGFDFLVAQCTTVVPCSYRGGYRPLALRVASVSIVRCVDLYHVALDPHLISCMDNRRKLHSIFFLFSPAVVRILRLCSFSSAGSPLFSHRFRSSVALRRLHLTSKAPSASISLVPPHSGHSVVGCSGGLMGSGKRRIKRRNSTSVDLCVVRTLASSKVDDVGSKGLPVRLHLDPYPLKRLSATSSRDSTSRRSEKSIRFEGGGRAKVFWPPLPQPSDRHDQRSPSQRGMTQTVISLEERFS